MVDVGEVDICWGCYFVYRWCLGDVGGDVSLEQDVVGEWLVMVWGKGRRGEKRAVSGS